MPLVRQHLAGSAELGHSRIDAGAAAGQGWNENSQALSLSSSHRALVFKHCLGRDHGWNLACFQDIETPQSDDTGIFLYGRRHCCFPEITLREKSWAA